MVGIISIIIVLVGLVVGGIVWAVKEDMKSEKGMAKGNGGLDEYNKERQGEVEKNKKKILEFLERKGKITNNEIQALVGVADATATRYMDELEAVGKVSQIGKTGTWVFYRGN